MVRFSMVTPVSPVPVMSRVVCVPGVLLAEIEKPAPSRVMLSACSVRTGPENEAGQTRSSTRVVSAVSTSPQVSAAAAVGSRLSVHAAAI